MNLNPVSKTIFYFGFYEVSVGLLFAIAPAFGARVAGLEPGEMGLNLLRIIGLLACVFSYYYFRCGFANDLHFARYSIHGRMFLMVAFPILSLSGILPMTLVGFGLVDFVGGLITWWAFRRNPHLQPG